MTDFIAKMAPCPLPAAQGGSLHLPSPNKSEATPHPLPGDRVLIWLNGTGLVGHGIVGRFDIGPPALALFTSFRPYRTPALGDAWLQAADRAGAGIRSRLRRATTTIGGLRALTADDLAEIEAARMQRLRDAR